MSSSRPPTGPDPKAITRLVLPLIAEAHDRLAAVRARHRTERDEQAG